MDIRKNIDLDIAKVQKKFIARKDEQDKFRSILKDLLNKSNEDNKRLFLINGEGGFGKTTLINKFIQICNEEDPKKNSLVVKIDWELFKIENKLSEPEKAIKMMDVIHDIFTPTYDNYFKNYRIKRKQHDKLNQAKSNSVPEFEKVINQTTNAMKTIAKLSDPSDIGCIDSTAQVAQSVAPIIQTFTPYLEDQTKKFNEWFKRKIKPDDYDLYDDPKGQLSKLIVKAILSVSNEKPLVLLFDTVEHILHINWFRSGLIKYAVPENRSILFVVAGKIPSENLAAFRNTIRDDYIQKSDLSTFSRFDIEDYVELRSKHLSDNMESYKFARLIEKVTFGIPLAVDTVLTALLDGYNINIFKNEDYESKFLNHENIVGIVSYRFLKHCLDNPDRESDKEYIFTIAVVNDEYDDRYLLLDYIWKSLFDESVNTDETITRLQAEYSFISPDGKMHPVVKRFVCSALAEGKFLRRGKLYEINQTAFDFFSSKIGKLSSNYQAKIHSKKYQCLAKGYLNHLIWLNKTDDSIDFLCNNYNLSIRFGEFDFANDLLSFFLKNEWVKYFIPKEQEELILHLHHFGSLIGQTNNLFASATKIKELIFNRLDEDNKILTIIDDIKRSARKGAIEESLNLAIKLEEILKNLPEGTFEKDKSKAYKVLGNAAYKQKKYSITIKYLEQSIKFKKEVGAMLTFGHALRHNKETDRAIAVYQEVIELNPLLEKKLKRIIHNLAKPIKEIKKSEDRLQSIIYNHEDYLSKYNDKVKGQSYYRIHTKLSKYFMEQGKFDVSLRERLIAEEGFGHLACSYRKTADLYLLIGDSQKALERIEKAKLIDVNSAYLTTANIYRYMRNIDEALHHYDLVINKSELKGKKKKYVEKEAYYGKAISYLLIGEYGKAETHILNASDLMINPEVTDDFKIYNALGMVSFLIDKKRKSITHFNKAINLADRHISISPSSFRPYFDKMISLTGKGEFVDAEKILVKALDICHYPGVLVNTLEKIEILSRDSKYLSDVTSIKEWIEEYI